MLNLINSLHKTENCYHFNRFHNIVTPVKSELLTLGERVNSLVLLILIPLCAPFLSGSGSLLNCSKELIAQIWTGKIYIEDKLLLSMYDIKNATSALRDELIKLQKQIEKNPPKP